MQFPINIKHHPLLGFCSHSMTRDVRWGSGVLSFCYLSLASVVLALMFIYPRSDVYVLDDPVSWFRIILQTFLLPSPSPDQSSSARENTQFYEAAIRSVNPRSASHSYLWPAMRPPLSKSGQCCPLVLVTTEVHIVWRSHAPHWPGAGARNTVYTTPGVASSSGAGAAQLCVDPRTCNMWPGERRQRKDDQPVKTSQMVKQWPHFTSALEKKYKTSKLQWD